MSRIEPTTVELYVGRWTEVTGDVATDPGVQISRGRQNEGTKLTTPTTCKFNLRNGAEASAGAGTYDPRWPASPYFGVLGKGTPVRVTLRRAWDTFARTVANGWGTSDAGGPWGIVGFGGPVAADFAVSSGAATHRVPNASAYALSFLQGFTQRDVDVQVTCSLPFSLVSGGVIQPANILLRYTDQNNYNLVRVEIGTDEAIAVKFVTVVAGVETVFSETATDGGAFVGTSITGLTHSATLSFTVRAVVENTTTRAKIWQSDQEEPFNWLWYCRSNANYGKGSVGIRSAVGAGNTNVPVTFTYDDFDVRSPRFYGSLSSLQQKQDKSGKNRWVEIEAADMLRRLQSGASPLQSALRRAIPSLRNLVAYWPMEDGATATTAAAFGRDTAPMSVTQGSVTFASNSAFEGSDKIPVPKNGTLQASVPPHAVGVEVTRFLLHCPASGLADGTALATIHTQGTISRWRLTYHTGGGLMLTWFDQAVVYVGDSGVISFAMDDRPVMLSVELQQSGGNINWAIVTVQPGASSGSAASGTVTGRALGAITDVYLTPDANVQNVAFGHLHVQNAFQSLFALGAPLNAWRNEFATNRALRLSRDENGVSLSSYRSPETPEWLPKVGAQGIKTLVDLFEETTKAAQGLIFASRAADHLYFRTHPSMQAQTPRAVLDAAAHQLETLPLPTDDDQALTNDVTATRTGGSSARAVLTSGRNSAASPGDDWGGVGTYASNTTYNVSSDGYLADYAAWALARGTWDGPRYPQLPVMRHADPVADDPELFAALLDVDQGDILLLENLPLGDDRAMVLGYRETITPIEHRFLFNAEPGDLWNIGVTDDADTRADAEGSTLAADATSTATTLAVANTTVPWIDSAGYADQFPFNITVGGEEMTVTAISGTSSPQTFTVTRSVNGIVKAHPAGATVQLADPVYAGLGPAL
ncbi:hypothetical protein [Amycolatopsis thermoflava]|uniref:hypothetical protein n=1 Tax=Amycolatopsis thermoflava TaxID=84480 RepID=UPI003EB9E1A5